MCTTLNLSSKTYIYMITLENLCVLVILANRIQFLLPWLCPQEPLPGMGLPGPHRRPCHVFSVNNHSLEAFLQVPKQSHWDHLGDLTEINKDFWTDYNYADENASEKGLPETFSYRFLNIHQQSYFLGVKVHWFVPAYQYFTQCHDFRLAPGSAVNTAV